MKPKLVFAVLAGLMICSIFSTSQGADKFYYGSYKAVELGPEHIPWQKDSLKFNIAQSFNIDASNIDSFAKYSMRAIPENDSEGISPCYWSKRSHYTLWEVEGLDGSYYKFTHAGWGTLVNDPSASGGKAWRFIGSGTPGIIQWGPSYEQEPVLGGNPISYTAEFRLKFLYSLYQPRGAKAGEPPTPVPVCSIMVVDRGTVLKDSILYKSDFPINVSYKTFLLGPYTVPDSNGIEFQIYWFAIPEANDFRIDYVKVYDNFGDQLMRGLWNSAITTYVNQPWTKTLNVDGDTVIYRWYMRDQPHSVDCFAPYAYIDTLLRQVSTERVGMQASNRILEYNKVFNGKRK
jgi:hypothetical protein